MPGDKLNVQCSGDYAQIFPQNAPGLRDINKCLLCLFSVSLFQSKMSHYWGCVSVEVKGVEGHFVPSQQLFGGGVGWICCALELSQAQFW